MRELTPRETVTEAIESLYCHWPLFANIASGFEIVEDKAGEITQTMATNGKQLFYHTDFVKELSIEETEWVILHECGHCFLGHHLRLIGEDRQDRNVSFDLALNSLIRGFAPSDKLRKLMLAPGHGPFTELEPDLDAETYFKAIGKPKQEEQQQSEAESEDSNEQEQSEGAGQSKSDEGEQSESEEQDNSSEGQGESEGDSSEGEGDGSEDSQGSASDASGDSESASDTSDESKQGSGNQNASKAKPAMPKPAQKATATPKRAPVTSMGEVLEHVAETKEAQAKAEGEWQQTIAESMAVAQQCGNLPGWLKALGEKLLGDSKTDWRTILRRFLTKSIPKGMNYAVPNRRHSWRKDVIMPGHRTKGGGDGIFIVDTSGSIYSIIRDAIVPEANKILRTLPKSSVRLMQVDTRVCSDETYSQYDLPLEITMQGGGGTDLNPALVAAGKDRGKLRWQIIVTDMYWGWQSAHESGIPTLWVVVGNPNFKGKPPFGEVVTVA